jgi:WD40 repeat protein
LFGAAIVLLLNPQGRAQESPVPVVQEYEEVSRLLIPLLQEPRSAAISPDGVLLATGHSDGAVILWRIEGGQPLKKLSGHAGSVDGLAFSHDGTRLASAGGDRSVRLWNVEAGESLRILAGHSQRIAAVCFSPDDRRLLTGGYDKTARLWDLESGVEEPLATLNHAATVCSAAYSPAGDRFATGTKGGEVRIWSATGEAQGEPIKAHQGAVGAMLFATDARSVFSGGDDGVVAVWNAETGELKEKLSSGANRPLMQAPVTRLTLSLDQLLLAIGDEEGGIQLWNLANGKPAAELAGPHGDICGLAFLPGSNSILSTSADRTVPLWRTKLPATPRLASVESGGNKVWAVAVAPDDSVFYGAGRDGLLASWSLATGERLLEFSGFSGTIDAIAVSPDGTRLACCGWNERTVALFNAQTAEKIRDFTTDQKVRCVQFSPDGRNLAFGQEDGQLKIQPLEGGEPKSVSTGSQAVYGIAFSPDGKQAATCSGNWREPKPGSTTLWKTEDWSEIRKLTEHTRAIRSVCFHPSGSLLATTSEDGLVILWHGESHVPVARIQNSSATRPVAFSPDGRRVAVGLHDGAINVWDVERQEIVQRFRTEGSVFGLAYTADGTALLSASGGPQMEIWPCEGQDSAATRIQRWVR